MELYDKVHEAKQALRHAGIGDIDLAIVLGTGLGKFTQELNITASIPFSSIPYFVSSTVEFHDGKLIYGTLNGKRVLALQGRLHYYEGYDFKDISFPIRVLKALNAKFLLMSGAAGTMNLEWQKGDLLLVKDHINLLLGNPLIGKNDDRLGTRFPDMSQTYSSELNQRLEKAAEDQGISLRSGIYVAAQGPMLETAAEYRFLRTIGADVVGMSTVPEAIVAKHAELPCSAVIVITDVCDPDDLKPINIPDIIEVAGKAEKKLIALITHLLKLL